METLANVFDNQALNTVYNYGSKKFFEFNRFILNLTLESYHIIYNTDNCQFPSAQDIEIENDIYITDPPYGDAVKYEEITEFFIAWLT